MLHPPAEIFPLHAPPGTKLQFTLAHLVKSSDLLILIQEKKKKKNNPTCKGRAIREKAELGLQRGCPTGPHFFLTKRTHHLFGVSGVDITAGPSGGSVITLQEASQTFTKADRPCATRHSLVESAQSNSCHLPGMIQHLLGLMRLFFLCLKSLVIRELLCSCISSEASQA